MAVRSSHGPLWSPRARATAGLPSRTFRFSKAGAFLLGVAGGGEALRGRGSGACRRREFGRASGRVSRAESQALASHCARRGPGRFHVPLSDRPDCRVAECCAAHRDRNCRAGWRRGFGPQCGDVSRARDRGDPHVSASASLFVHWPDPNASWLKGCVGSMARGSSSRARMAWTDESGPRLALPLETNRPGVFAIGDVRAGSTKRVAAAVGEGAAVVAQIHNVLALA